MSDIQHNRHLFTNSTNHIVEHPYPNDVISILNFNVNNIKKNLSQLSLMMAKDVTQVFLPSKIDTLKKVYHNDNLSMEDCDKEIYSLLNKYKSNEDTNYLENKLKKLLISYSLKQ